MLFSDVLVPQHVKDVLINTVKSKRISHAQLFLYQEGMPGLALALAYCQYISCQHRTEESACGVCPSCLKFKDLVHADLHFVFPNVNTSSGKSCDSTDYYDKWREIMLEKNGLFTLRQWAEMMKADTKRPIINVRDASQLINIMQAKPYESEYRFVIIWLPELMNETAANKLLKTLEEPDGKTLIILVSENADKILPTILSRTQLLKINKFPTEDFAQIVSQQIKCDYDTAVDIGYITNFNLQQALEIGVNVVDTENFTCFVEMMRMAYLLYHMPSHKVDFTIVENWLSKIDKLEKESRVTYLNYTLNLVRKCMLINAESASLIKSPTEEEKFLKSFAPFVHLGNGRQIMEVLDNAIRDMLVYNAETKMLFTDVLLQIGKFLTKKEQ